MTEQQVRSPNSEIYGLSRADAIAEVSKVRYPGVNRRIGRNTFWRWCDLLGLKPRKGIFYPTELKQLREVAFCYRTGGTQKDLIQDLSSVKKAVASEDTPNVE